MIELNNVTKIYNKGKNNEIKALDDVSFEMNEGDMVSIMGKSGAGKSTLLHIIGCIDYCDSGVYSLNKDIIAKLPDWKLSKIRNKRVGIVLQNYGLINDLNALENVLLPLDFSFSKLKRKKKKEKALNALEMIGIKDLAYQKVNEMSGGQKQRVAIARAIANDPDIILADEPTGNLDYNTGTEIMKVFTKLNSKGKTIIIVTHEKEVANYCKRIIYLEDGKIINEEVR